MDIIFFKYDLDLPSLLGCLNPNNHLNMNIIQQIFVNNYLEQYEPMYLMHLLALWVMDYTLFTGILSSDHVYYRSDNR